MRRVVRGLLPGLLVVLAVVLADRFAPAEGITWFVSTYTVALRSWRRPRRKPKEGRKSRKRQPKKLSVTVRIGVADSAGDASQPHAVLAEADRALYRAKKGGRNRVSG